MFTVKRMFMFFGIFVAATGLFLSPAAAAEMKDMDHSGDMGDHAMPWFGRVPSGVMGGTTHHAGGWMVMYNYMHMDMEGNRDGTDGLTTADVLADYMVAPESMTMDMHMFGLMYGLTPRFTAMAMVPYTDLSMDHVTRMGAKFTTDANGLGDIKVVGMYLFPGDGPHSFHVNAGLSLPTGSIDERDATPMGPDQKLPYPMQLGSGTWDLVGSLTYRSMAGPWQWGGQVDGTLRLGENDNDYTLGNRAGVTGWLSRGILPWLSATARLDWGWWGNIDGADPDLNPMMVPTADPDRRGGNRLDGLLGLNAVFGGYAFLIEAGLPVYQSLDGPQLETDWTLSAAFQMAF